MLEASKTVLRVTAMVGVALVVFAADVSSAHAQSASCSRLEDTLATFDRNGEYHDVQANTQAARRLAEDLQHAESTYVRNGCNDDAKAGRTLTRECRTLARQINGGREDYDNLARSVETGNAVAQQREAVLQEIARFGCGGGSRVRVFNDDNQGNRGNLFDRLFGSLPDTFDGAGGFRGGEFDPYGDFHTVRTLCVRKSDGYFWPVSYSTLPEYAVNDAQQCSAQCPGVDVDLYYYDNPGQEPEQMVNLVGEAYIALPNAFRFRTEFDKASTCKPQVDYGSIELGQSSGGQSRAMIAFNGLSFPLPLRDPRRPTEVTQAVLEVAEIVNVPLPRARPTAPGEAPKPVSVAPLASSEPARIVRFGDKRVRIVGPDTPYAPSAATGT